MNRRRYSVQRWLIRKNMADTRSSYHQQTVTTQRGRHVWGGHSRRGESTAAVSNSNSGRRRREEDVHHDPPAAWVEEDQRPQEPGQRGTRGRSRMDGGGQDAQSVGKTNSHCIGGAQLATQRTRLKVPPPMHWRSRARSAGAAKSTAVEELALVLGEYTRFTPPPRMVFQLGCDPAIRMRLYTRIETE